MDYFLPYPPAQERLSQTKSANDIAPTTIGGNGNVAIHYKDVERAISLRSSGLTIGAVADELKISQSALKQIYKKFDVKKYDAKDLLIQAARKRLLEDASLSENMAVAISSSVLSDINLAKQIRDNASILFEKIFNDSYETTQQKARALAALATAALAAQSLSQRAISFNKEANNDSSEDLPELKISSYTDEEIEAIRTRASMSDLDLARLDAEQLEAEQEGGMS